MISIVPDDALRARFIATASAEARICDARGDRCITYPKAAVVLDQMERILAHPRNWRMPSLLILAFFVLAAVLAGLSGLLYVQWGNYITPTQVGLLQASLPVIWVAVGGRDSLVAVALSTYLLNWLNFALSSAGNQYAMVIIGVLLVAVMMFFPRGILVTLARDLPRHGWRATLSAALTGR